MATSALQDLLATAAAHTRHQIERIESQLDFAERLCGLHAEQAEAWRPLIAAARERVARALKERALDSVADAVAEAETILAPLAKAAKRYTIHLVGHAHIDMNWMWSWPETVSVTVDTFATVLRLMETFPEFTFSQSQASTYEIVERLRPDLFEAIRARVAEGRWEVLASHWVEGDKNMAGGESLCRHLLLTRAYFKDRFGLRPRDVPVDWSPDTFGHPATMPTYLAQGDVRYLYLHRPGHHSPEKPGAWWWEGPDGSRVLVRNDMALGYNGIIDPQTLGPRSAEFCQFTGGRDFMFVYGVGDHGGGPTRRDILRALDMAEWPVFPALRFSTARTFFGRLARAGDRLPVLRGEFNTEFSGCFTSESLIKRANRLAENRLADAEVARSFAWLAADLSYPADLLNEAWKDTLFSHFHDILPGSGVHDTRTYTHGLFQKSMATTGTLETEALRRLAALVDTRVAKEVAPRDLPPSHITSSLGAGVGFRSAEGELPHSDQSGGDGPRPLVVFNPTDRERTEVVEATLWDHALPGTRPFLHRTYRVRGPEGDLISAQPVRQGRYWGHEFQTVAFPVQVPAFGYRLCSVEEGTAGEDAPAARQLGWTHPCNYAPPERSPEGLENDRLRIELAPETGGIRSLLDKASGLDLIGPCGPARILEYAVERPHGMTAWNADHTGPAEHPVVTAIRREGNGPHLAAIAVDLRIRESNLTLTYSLRGDDPRLHLQVQGVWFQRGTKETGVPVLRLALPLALTEARTRSEIPFGAVDRAFRDGEEMPMLQWTQVMGRTDDTEAGILLANDAKHGTSLTGSTLRVTLIRSSYDPDILPEIGQHDMRFTLRPWAGDLPVETAIREGTALNRPLKVVSTDVHAGPWPAAASLLETEPTAAVVCGLKRSEHGKELVVRLINPTDQPLKARLRPDSTRLGKLTRARLLDLMERPVKGGAVKVKGGKASLDLPARGLATVALGFA